MTQWDAATLQIVWQRLISVADEMAAVLLRTAFSSVVRESNDLACAVLTARGDLLVEYGRSVPVFTGTVAGTVRAMVAELGEHNLRPGDVIATNSPRYGNTHLPDLTAATPVFRDGRIVAYVASICHLSDIGGTSEGAFAQDAFEEGFCLPPVKLVEAGVPNALVRRILAANVRVPAQVLGDVDALIAANALGERRVTALLDSDAGLDLDEAAAHICDATERAVRASIAEIPDGHYAASIDLDGFEEPKTIVVSVEVHGDSMTVDYEGTSRQSTFGINSASPTFGYTRYGLACLLAPELPNNEGALRPIAIRVPEGSLLNPRTNAAVSANFPAHAIPSVLSRALADVLPDRVSAAAGTPFWVVGIRGEKETGPFASLLCFNGGQGAARGQAGYATLSTPSNVSNTPVEIVESQAPVLVESKSIVRGSGGEGAWRGGDGQEVALVSRHDAPLDVIFLTERIEHAAPGLAGGGDGAPGVLRVDGGDVAEPKGRIRWAPGSRILMRTPGGGGYGAR
ncbi:MAG: hydantoinase [Microbacterium sp.]|uniref:Acetophenone carboxylase delta subunit n=1 Tax=Microbacterium ginsengisoli TaxID=400772 RepID=A0A0F0LY24_9MICO|nr:hydantoinase B/oxoprolinase family protein [Microbacterium ginsengisoli]KJL38302.1 Acetophenone carboxylase delta subunit [Microbacterium ginsengisoli]MAL05355.1 hydantoinase [Microbacterium sp.]HAN25463.1 hydantoinase B/oxoprolinase family protein [Microbacterium ginsengisoli]